MSGENDTWLLKELGGYSDDTKEDEEINKKLKEY